jgi:type IV pilus assembly protein PilO
VVILTMHDVSLKPAKGPGTGVNAATGQLSLDGTVKTYRYLDDEEAASVQQAEAARKGGKKPPAPAKPAKGGE